MSSLDMILMREVTRSAQAGGKRLRGAQHAVDAVAHEDRVGRRLEVDVGGARLHGIGDDLVDQADGRRLARHIAQALHVDFTRLGRAVDARGTLFGSPE